MAFFNRFRFVELTAFAIRDLGTNEYLKERRNRRGKATLQFEPPQSINGPRLYKTERAAKIALSGYDDRTDRYLKVETVRSYLPK